MEKEIKKISLDVAIVWAFYIMNRSVMTIDEVKSYIELLEAILPKNYILEEKDDAVSFLLECYPSVFSLNDELLSYTPNDDCVRWFMTDEKSKTIFASACQLLEEIEGMSDEIKTPDNMNLKRTI